MKSCPLSAPEQEAVLGATRACLRRAADLYGFDAEVVPVSFDLKGRAAGMYQVKAGQRRIRYNPFIFARYPEDNLAVTVPHEVAHYVIDRLYGIRNTKPHGAEWKSVMRALGADPRATADYDLTGLPVRRQKRFAYRCDCSTHLLSASRHNRVDRGDASYLCRKCGSTVRRAENEEGCA